MMFRYIFVYKQKTAYEMRISDWSSDVCSSDLPQGLPRDPREGDHQGVRLRLRGTGRDAVPELPRSRRSLCERDDREGSEHARGASARQEFPQIDRGAGRHRDRKSAVQGKSESERVVLGV